MDDVFLMANLNQFRCFCHPTSLARSLVHSPTYAWIYYIFACPHLSTWPRCHSYHTLFRVIILIFHLFEMLPCYWQLLSLTVKVGPLSLEFVRTFWCQSRCTVAVIFNIRFSNPNKHRHALSHLCRSSKHMTMAKSKVVISSTFFFVFSTPPHSFSSFFGNF